MALKASEISQLIKERIQNFEAQALIFIKPVYLRIQRVAGINRHFLQQAFRH